MPIAIYHLELSEFSKLRLQPLIVVNANNPTSRPTFLVQRSLGRKEPKKRDDEWTWKLAASTESQTSGTKKRHSDRLVHVYFSNTEAQRKVVSRGPTRLAYQGYWLLNLFSSLLEKRKLPAPFQQAYSGHQISATRLLRQTLSTSHR
jgi:hypothetical protein